MCFSLEASMTMGAALIPAGSYCISQAVKHNPKYIALAAIPLAFGIQQLGEAIVWKGMEMGDTRLVQTGSLIFLFFALPFWPFWIPLSASFLDKRKFMRRFCQIISVLGFIFGMAFYLPMASNPSEWLSTSVCLNSIRYDMVELPLFHAFPVLFQTFYLAATAIPLFFSFDWRIRIFGVVLLLLAGIAHASYWYAFTSVWCFFAAFLSVNLCFLFSRMTRKAPKPVQSGGPLGILRPR